MTSGNYVYQAPKPPPPKPPKEVPAPELVFIAMPEDTNEKKVVEKFIAMKTAMDKIPHDPNDSRWDFI